jgi:hypothetical protein
MDKQQTTEVALSLAVIIVSVLAIAVFISSGAGIAFYGLFLVAAAIMVYAWYRISKAPAPGAFRARGARRTGKTARPPGRKFRR